MRLRPRFFFSGGRYRVLEPDEGKLSSPVLRGLEASNGLRLLGKRIEETASCAISIHSSFLTIRYCLACRRLQYALAPTAPGTRSSRNLAGLRAGRTELDRRCSFQGKQFRLRCRSRLLISTWTTSEYGLFSNPILAPLK